MPIIPDDNMQHSVDKVIDYVAPETNNVPFKEKLTAAFRLENTVISAISQFDGLPDGYADTDYNVFENLTSEEKKNDRFVGIAALSDNDNELNAVREQYKRELEDKEKASGVDGFAAMLLGGIADPINLVPVGGAAAKAYKTGSILKGGLLTGLAASGTAAVTEAGLHMTQLARTGDESIANVTGAMLLGGILGGGAAALNRNVPALDIAAKEIEETFEGPMVNTVVDGGSVGAASVWGDVRIKGKYVEKALRALRGIDPTAKVMTAKSQKARRYGAQMFENVLEVEGFKGRSIEQAARTKHSMYFGQALGKHSEAFVEAKKNGFKGKRGEFNIMVSKEVANPGTTGNKFARKSAEAWEKHVYSPVAKDLQELHMLGDELDVKTAAKYINRRWNKEAVSGKINEFRTVVSKWLKQEQPDIDDAEELADEIAMRIMGTPDGMIRYDDAFTTSKRPKVEGDVKAKSKPAKGGRGLNAPFKARKFLIPDELVDQFLLRDIEQLAHIYLRHTVPDMEMVRTFGSPKTPIDDVLELRYQKKEILEDYKNLASKAKTEKEANKIIKEGQSVIEALVGIRDRLRGRYDLPEGIPSIGRRINAAFRNLNYVRLLGGVLASSVPDIGKQVMAEGFERAFGDGFAPLVKNLADMKPIKSEMRFFGIALEAVSSGRVEALADINSYALGNSKVERGLEYLADRFGNIAMINQWNDAMKTAHALAMQARVFEDLAKGKFDNRLARLGLTEDEAIGIYSMAKKHGKVLNGARLFAPEKWERQDWAFAWAAALRKESDRVVIVPGQEKPLFMSRDVGKTVLQFRSFMLSSTQRTLLSAAQGQEANMLGGVLTMTTLGAMVYAFKQWDSGREISTDPMVLISEGIDRSGVLGIIMEASNTLEKITGNRFGLRTLMGVTEPASRFASMTEFDAMLGPTYGSALPGILRLATAGSDDNEWKAADTSALRRMLPFQNFIFFRRGVNAAEKFVHEELIE